MSVNRIGQSKQSLTGPLLVPAELFWKILSLSRGPGTLPPSSRCLPSGPQVQGTTQAGVGNTSCAVACAAHGPGGPTGEHSWGRPTSCPRRRLSHSFAPTPKITFPLHPRNRSHGTSCSLQLGAHRTSGGQQLPPRCLPHWECPSPPPHSDLKGVTWPPPWSETHEL